MIVELKTNEIRKILQKWNEIEEKINRDCAACRAVTESFGQLDEDVQEYFRDKRYEISTFSTACFICPMYYAGLCGDYKDTLYNSAVLAVRDLKVQLDRYNNHYWNDKRIISWDEDV